MQISTQSSFVKYELDEVETLSGFTFHEANRAVIQNLIADYAEEFMTIALRADGTEHVLSLEERLRIAETRGAFAALKYLLSAADALKEEQLQKQLQRSNSPDSQNQI